MSGKIKIYDILPPKADLREEGIPQVVQKERKLKEERKYLPSGFKIGKKLEIAGGGILLLMVVFGAIYFRFLEARITIWPKQEPWEFRKEINIKEGARDIDLAASSIPGRVIQAEEEIFRQFPATGEVVKETKAKGIIKVYNNYHQPQILVATTRFLSAEGKLFRSTHQVRIPANGETDVEVEAAEPGVEYNIEPSTFSIPGLAGTARYTKVYGKSFSKMEGGTKDSVPQVTAGDIEKAKETIDQELTKKAKEKLLAQTGDEKNLVFFEETLFKSIKEVEALVSEGAEVDTFQARGKINAKAMVFDRKDIEKFLKDFMLKEIGSGKAVNEESFDMQITPVKMDWEQNTLTVSVEGSFDLYQQVDTEELKNKIAGQPVGAVRAMLDGTKVFERSQIELWPIPWRSVPKDVDRIRVEVRLGPK